MLMTNPTIKFHVSFKKWGVECFFPAQKITFWYFLDNYHWEFPRISCDLSNHFDNNVSNWLDEIAAEHIKTALKNKHRILEELYLLQDNENRTMLELVEYNGRFELHAHYKDASATLILREYKNNEFTFLLKVLDFEFSCENEINQAYPNLIKQCKKHPHFRLKLLLI